jgi:hypothetical protein
VTVATEEKTMMVSSLKTVAKGMTAVMKMITAVSTALSLLLMQMGTTSAMTMALTRAITVVLAATVLHKVTAATEAKAMAVGLAASASLLIAKVMRILVFVPHPLSCQHGFLQTKQAQTESPTFSSDHIPAEAFYLISGLLRAKANYPLPREVCWNCSNRKRRLQRRPASWQSLWS